VNRSLPRRTLLAVAVAAVAAACSRATRPGAAAPATTTGTGTGTGTPTVPAPTATTPPPTTPAAATGPAVEVGNGPRGSTQVALTFHASGAASTATQVLAALAATGAQVTVFVVGTWLRDNPAMAATITAAGHELANHTWSHPTLENLDEAGIRDELLRCRDELAAAGTPPRYARQSGAQHSTPLIRKVAGELGYPTVVSYDVDSLDFTDPGAATVRAQVATATGGSIVSMHFGHADTVSALPGVLGDLAARGLTPVTLSTMLGAA
jgi:peptidoglycan/xylan/chitin deacetylase (PgdA/CDA1 family)